MKRTKAEWRQALLSARAAIPEAARRAGSAAILDHVRGLAGFEGARSLLGYTPLGAEADPGPLLTSKVGSGTVVYLPSARRGIDDEPCWVRWQGEGTVLPASPVSADFLEYPVLAIVPGVGFDEHGVRLGRGRGYYDRALAELRRLGTVRVVGLAFECQVVRDLPHDSWDQRVDFIATDRRLVTASYVKHRDGEAGVRWS
jgi:5-formyltetrahydrofolate cyclo-ligase